MNLAILRSFFCRIIMLIFVKLLPTFSTVTLLVGYFKLGFVQARLSIGDVVKCRIKKITFFGIFVEVYIYFSELFFTIF